MRSAYKCRVYLTSEQESVLNRTFGCVRVVWNQTLAWRRQRYHDEHAKTSYAQASAHLAVRNMARNHSLARSISDCGWGAFRRMIEYKAERAGRRVIAIDRFYPSSKTCSACGHLLASLSLSTRHWSCPSCGTRHDRDVNAAKNILAAGLAAARSDPGDACGADVRHSGTSRVRSAVKQEPRPARAGIPVHQGGE
jgi:putative transposase